MKRSLRLLVLPYAAVLGMVAALPATVSAHNLANPGTASGPHQDFGSSTAISDRFILVGETGNRAHGVQAGAAHVFDAKTGRHLRRLLAPDTAAGNRFGFAVAISGNRALIGAPGAAAGRGRAYLFELSSGRLLRRIEPHPQVAAAAQFGAAVALNGRHAVIGAPFDSPFGATGLGSAHVLDLSTGEFLHSKTSIFAPDNAFFGKSVATDGKVFVVGAPGETNLTSSRAGAAHVYDLVTGERLHRLLASDGQMNDRFGESVAVGSGWVLAGAPGKSETIMHEFGGAYVFDLAHGTQLAATTASAPNSNQNFGQSVGISGCHLVIGAPGENASNASAVGAVYVIDFSPTGSFKYRLQPQLHAAGANYGRSVAISGRQLITGYHSNMANGNTGAADTHSIHAAWQQRIVAKRSDLAPNANGQRYAGFFMPSVNQAGQTAFASRLSGDRSIPSGTWAELTLGLAPVSVAFNGGPLNLQTRAGAPLSLVHNHAANAVLETRIAGSGGGRGLFRVANGLRTLLLRNGAPIPGINDALVRDFSSPSQFSTEDRLVVPYRLVAGNGGVTAGDDSGIHVLNHFGIMQTPSFREGAGIGNFLGTFRQFLPRAAIQPAGNQTAFAAYRTPSNGGSVTELSLFTRALSSGSTQLAAHAGQAAPQAPGAVFRGFLGETLHNGELLFRASLSGDAAAVNAATREGLWLGGDLCLRQGVELSVGGPRVGRIMGFWPSIPDHLLALVRLTGKGVNRSNDLALLCVKRNGQAQVLMREGAAVDGSEGSRVGVIQRVEACPTSGRYVVLTSLTGAGSRNQALHSGQLNLTEPEARLGRRLPSMKLRKGTGWMAQAGQTTALSGITLQPHLNPGGAGATGHRSVLNNQGRAIFGARFSNGADLLVEGGL